MHKVPRKSHFSIFEKYTMHSVSLKNASRDNPDYAGTDVYLNSLFSFYDPWKGKNHTCSIFLIIVAGFSQVQTISQSIRIEITFKKSCIDCPRFWGIEVDEP
jgi:hypothetical protein